MFKILCLDGGGIRGYFSLMVLANIEKEYNINIYEYFDLIVGTSTGSIIASGISLGMPVKKIMDIYKKEQSEIFTKKENKKILDNITLMVGAKSLFSTIYTNDNFKKVLDKYFLDLDFKDTKTKLVITTTDIKNKKPILFRSWQETNELNLKEAIMASSSAPIFFEPFSKDKLYADGGLWANNPILVGLSEAISLNADIQDIKMLSIGTGLDVSQNSFRQDEGFGVLTWSKIAVPIIVQTNLKCNINFSKQILKDRFLRIDFKTKNKLSISELSDSLIENANNEFNKNKEQLNKFFKEENTKKKELNRIQKFVKKLFKL